MLAAYLVPFFGLALLDSINPSALVVTLQLLSRKAPVRAILVYVGAVFVTYTSVTIILMLGLTAVLDPLAALLETRAANIALAVLGAGMLVYAVFSRNPKDAPEKLPLRMSTGAAGGLFLLGMTVTVMELPTAFPLLGAVGILSSADLSLGVWLPLVLVYNVVFVLPPLILTFAYRWIGERGGANLERRLSRGARETMLWIVGAIGFYMLMYALGALGVLGDWVSFDFG